MNKCLKMILLLSPLFVSDAQADGEFGEPFYRQVRAAETSISSPGFRGNNMTEVNRQVTQNTQQLQRANAQLQSQYQLIAQNLQGMSSLGPAQQALAKTELVELSQKALRLENLAIRLAEATQKMVNSYSTSFGVDRGASDIKDSGTLSRLTKQLGDLGAGTSAKNFMQSLRISVSQYRGQVSASRPTPGLQADYSTMVDKPQVIREEITRQIPRHSGGGVGVVGRGRTGDINALRGGVFGTR